MDNNQFFKSFTGQVFFLEENYVPKNVINNFRKLRNIILNTQSEFIQYIVEEEISEHINTDFKKQFGHIESNYSLQFNDEIKLRYCSNKYIYAIVCVTL